jgi:hypothetical protein
MTRPQAPITVLTLAILLAFSLHPNRARAGASPAPEAIVSGVYHNLIDAEAKGVGYQPPESFYTARLKALVALSRRQAKGEAACGLDFIFWFNGQDYKITDLTVTRGPTPAPDRTTVTATFNNLGDAEKIVFDFRKVDGRWELDDAQSLAGDKWVFSRLLQCKA